VGKSSAWEPIPEFSRSDADISLFFLAPNNVFYIYPNSDPMFSANIETNFTHPSALESGNITQVYWEADYFIYVMGCTD
jgi:hypothetical protein